MEVSAHCKVLFNVAMVMLKNVPWYFRKVGHLLKTYTWESYSGTLPERTGTPNAENTYLICKGKYGWPPVWPVKWFRYKNDWFWQLHKNCLRMWEIPQSNKSPNLVTLYRGLFSPNEEDLFLSMILPVLNSLLNTPLPILWLLRDCQ